MITKKEIKKILSLIILITAWGLIVEPIRELLKSAIPINPFIIGIGLIVLGAYMFEI